jgi:hypothetical protein
MMEASEIRGMIPRTLVKWEIKCPESLPEFLPHGVEVGLHAVLLVSAGKVRCEPCAELFPGIDLPWVKVHEPSPGRPRQADMKICRHHTAVFPPAAVMAVTYTYRNSDGFDVLLYFSGRCGRNLAGQDAA